MKRSGNGHSRLLSMLLSLVLLVSLVPVIGLPASAGGPNLTCTGVTVEEKYSSGCLKTMTISFDFNNTDSLASAKGQFAVHNGAYSNKYHKYPASAWPDASTIQATDSTFIAFGTNSVDDYYWTRNQYSSKSDSISVTFDDNIIKPGETYYLYLWTLSGNFGVYPEQLLTTIKLDPPAHAWDPNPVTTGNGTKEAVTTVTCSCGTQVRVSLTASDVTLPGNAFSAKIDVEEIQKEVVAAAYGLRAARSAAPQLSTGHGLTVSDEPGYKYSPDGSNFTDIDPNTFTPAPGFYQASILVKDGNTTLENLYVTYTVRDPAVTAETGDSRPIELMVMGMALFSALAIAAFVLDSRRKANR